jgi:hypothetical protein
VSERVGGKVPLGFLNVTSMIDEQSFKFMLFRTKNEMVHVVSRVICVEIY